MKWQVLFLDLELWGFLSSQRVLENGCWKLFSRQINGYTKFRPEIHAASTYISRLKTKPKKKFLPELHWTEEGEKYHLQKNPLVFPVSLFDEFFNFTEKNSNGFQKNCKQTPVHGTRTHVRGFGSLAAFKASPN